MNREINKKGILLVIIFFVFHIMIEIVDISALKNFMLSNNLDGYFTFLVYLFFACAFLIIYRKKIVPWVKDFFKNKEKYSVYMVITFIAIMFFMISSAIILSKLGFEKSGNQQTLDIAIEKNRVIMMITACILGPIVEEMVFRLHLCNLISIENNKVIMKTLIVIVSALIFALYHISINEILQFDYKLLLPYLPIMFMGVGAGFLQVRTSNIICSLVVHMLINFIAAS